jgi:hypothetical protein
VHNNPLMKIIPDNSRLPARAWGRTTARTG